VTNGVCISCVSKRQPLKANLWLENYKMQFQRQTLKANFWPEIYKCNIFGDRKHGNIWRDTIKNARFYASLTLLVADSWSQKTLKHRSWSSTKEDKEGSSRET
jgi:hypothetical protein